MVSDRSLSLALPPRIPKRDQFLYVQSRGHRVRSRSVTLLSAPAAGDFAHGSTLVGYTVSRRVGHAVCRNSVRRRLREAVRLHQHELGHGLWYVLIAHPQAAERSTEELMREVLWLLNKARR